MLATHINGHPGVPITQPVRWRLQLPSCQLGLQQNMSNGESLDSWATSNNLGKLYDPKESASFSLTDGASAPTRTWPSRVSDRTADCRRDVFEESSRGHNIGPHNATKTQGSCPQRFGEALELSQG